MREGGAIYLLIYGVSVTFFLGTVLALGLLSLPRLLCHWTWLLFATYATAVFICRWLAKEAEAWLLFWATPMVNGLLWFNLVLVPMRGVTPSALWRAFGEHGGPHLMFAQVGDVVLLLMPPIALLAFLFWERRYLRAIFHDFCTQLAPGHVTWNIIWHMGSPLLPLAAWAAFFRTSLFSDLPQWPPVLDLLGVCCLSNTPLLFYAHLSTADMVGPAHWFDAGVVLWSAGRLPRKARK